MNIEFERTIEDIIDFNLFHMTHSPSTKRQLLLMRVLTGALAAIPVFGIGYLLYHSINASTLVLSILAGFVAFAFYPQANRQSTIKRINKMLSEGNNNTLLGHQVISLSPEGIYTKNPTTESKINWSAIGRVVESDAHVYLYTSSINALVIPKKCFRTEKERQDFLEYVNKYRQHN